MNYSSDSKLELSKSYSCSRLKGQLGQSLDPRAPVCFTRDRDTCAAVAVKQAPGPSERCFLWMSNKMRRKHLNQKFQTGHLSIRHIKLIFVTKIGRCAVILVCSEARSFIGLNTPHGAIHMPSAPSTTEVQPTQILVYL